jgi:transcriptional regulator with XRE-family HTH domain
MDKYSFGNRLYELRTKKGFTQEKFGKMLGVGKTAVSKWENGTTQPRLPMLEKIAACFDITIEELLEYGSERITETKYYLQKPSVEIPNEINMSPRIAVNFLMDYNWLKIDIPKTISTIKNNYKISNRELSKILQVQQKSVGLWENGIKRPSIKNIIKLILLFHNKNDNTTQVFVSQEKDLKALIIINLFFIIAYLTFVWLYYFICITGDSLKQGILNENNPFDIQGLISFIIPSSLIYSAFYISLKCIINSGERIKRIILSTDLFLIACFIYLFICCMIFPSSKTAIFCLLFNFVYCVFVRFVLKDKIVSDLKYLVINSIPLLFLIALSITTCDIFANKNLKFSNTFTSVSIIMFVVLSILNNLNFERSKYYLFLKQYLPIIEHNETIISTKEKVFLFCVMVISLLYAILIEINKYGICDFLLDISKVIS